MLSIRIKRGLDIPISGAIAREPTHEVASGPAISHVAVLGTDYPGLAPVMAVKVGDPVVLGQLLFSDKKNEGVSYVSPGTGTVMAINRGDKRALQSVVIALSNAETDASLPAPAEQLLAPGAGKQAALTRAQVQDGLLASGLWTALRTRPFGKVPLARSVPAAIFVTAMDTSPLAFDPAPVLAQRREDFTLGLGLLRLLTDGKVYLCTAPGADIPGRDAAGVTHVEFAGPHPAGLAGTHIHFLEPVHAGKTVWHVGCQDVVAIGRVFATGMLSTERVVSLAGPGVSTPRLVRTRLGASCAELTAGQLLPGEQRVVSGSILCGHQAAGPLAYLGRTHTQVSVLPEGRTRELLGWIMPGLRTHSATFSFLSSLLPGKRFALDTSTHGSLRALVPIGMYERVLPLDLEPAYLLRALAMRDADAAAELGALELAEEDLGLCSYVCASKSDFGGLLRETLTLIEKDA
ncbi:MAG: Na(+)-translocating NADH-quinone reductase subunit A [Myxococcota bacterium]|jgi:Na+-transporting NADH:ubiquinone oxidoreductase subunit A|nr:Na(+)-translocating NADH-quinone reductase subunit A [Myxococcota bacterium]